MVQVFVVTERPAIRSYGGLPALRTDTWVCPYTPALLPPYHYYRVYLRRSLALSPFPFIVISEDKITLYFYHYYRQIWQIMARFFIYSRTKY